MILECGCGFQVHASVGIHSLRCARCREWIVDKNGAALGNVCYIEHLPYSLPDRWRRAHRWPLRHPEATPEEVRDFASKWDEPLSCMACQGEYEGLKNESRFYEARTADELSEAFRAMHNAVNRKLGRPEWSADEVRREHGRLAVGFLAASYLSIGGTETWNRTILPRLSERIRVEGLVVTGPFRTSQRQGIGCPVAAGESAARELASRVDVLVTWGVPYLDRLLPKPRPKLVGIHHGDLVSDWFEAYIAAQSDILSGVVCVHPEAAERAKRLPIRSAYIPNAVDSARLEARVSPEQVRRNLGLVGTKICLWLARFSLEKRVYLAAEAAKLLPEGWAVVIAGEGPERPSVEDAPRVKLIGPVETPAELLSVADCFLSTTEMEGFGLSMAEAMLAGVPVVATPHGLGERKDLVESIPEPPSPQEIASAILRATRDAERTIRAKEYIEREHNPEKIADAWVSFLREISGLE